MSDRTITSHAAPEDFADLVGIDAVRTDGGLVHIRPIGSGDLAALDVLHSGVSDRSLYLRFFSASRASADAYVAKLAQPASRQHLALTAWIDERLVGVAAFERLSDDSAEVALLIADERHDEGIGTLLLEHLADAARRVGILHFEAEVLVENGPALTILRDLGYELNVRFEGMTELIVINLSPDARTFTAVEEREQHADEASLRHVLSPTSVAVIGAGARPDSIGHQVLQNILRGGFIGAVYAVNPRHDTLLGVPCVPRAQQLPIPVDLAVIAVPADQVPGVVRDCGERGVRGLLLLTAGFSEIGDRGRDRQREIVSLARRYGMRLVGPNCVGVCNTDPTVRLNATFANLPSLPGTLGLVSQSGALGIAVIDAAARWGLGISQFLSMGNKADVSGNDLLLAWQEDDRTRVIALYLESFGNPRKFSRIAREVSRSKPIIAIKAGRSAAGSRAGQSHTAAAASSDVVVDALFTQAGVLRVDTMEQMLDAARVLCDQPLPRGPRVVVVGNSGGPGILAADAAESAGLEVVSLTAETERQLRVAVPSAASCHNPVDLGAAVRPAELVAALQVLLRSDDVDAVLAIFTGLSMSDPGGTMSQIAAVAGGGDKPLIASQVGAEQASIIIPGSDFALPVFTFPEPAAAALGQAVRYARIRSAPRAPTERPSGIDRSRAADLVEHALMDGEPWLDPVGVEQLLSSYGLPQCPQRVVTGADEAVAAAGALGYPVVAKVAEPGLHKTDIGGVRIGLGDEAAVRSAFADLAALCTGPAAVLLQPMLPPSTEVIIGALQDPQFGPLVMIGAGGVLANLIADRAFRLAPLTLDDAQQMIGGLRTAPLFDGFRGAPVVSRKALGELLIRVAAIADDFPEVAELDLNPVICDGDQLVIVDARIRIAHAPRRLDPLLRQLR